MDTIIDLFERSCVEYPDNAYLWEKKDGKYVSMSYAQAHERVMNIAAGFQAYHLKKGQRVALLSEGRCDWACCELGILYAGGVNVPLSIKLTEQELIFRLNHSGSRFIVVSAYYVETIRRIERELTDIENIFVFSPFSGHIEKYVLFEQLLEAGRIWRSDHRPEFERMVDSITKEDMAGISYTSGTTAEPKGIMLTHGNYVSNVLQSDSLIHIPANYKVLLCLPWDHSFAHTVGIYSFMYNGASVAAVDFGKSPMEYLRNIPVNLQEVKPHILLSVPAIAGNFRKNIEAGIRKKGRIFWRIYLWGLWLAYFYNGTGNHCHKGVKLFLYPFVKLFDWILFSKVRKSFGGNLQFFVGGGALLDIELQRYYKALGVPMYQGYGLSEASPVISSNTPRKHKFGTSGLAVVPMDLKICNENGEEMPEGQSGEIVIRGGNVMKGYWKNEKSTAEVVKKGWLYTGDLGYMDRQGFLYVLGRFKSLLIAGDGEKYSPEGIEESIVERSKYIDYCVLYNNQSAYTSGMIVPNKSALKEYVARKNIEFGSVEGYKLMLVKIRQELMEYRYGGKYAGLFPERWLPAVVVILPDPLSEYNGTINSTTKVVRRRVIELYKEELDFAYTPEGKDIQNVRNTQNIRRFFVDKN